MKKRTMTLVAVVLIAGTISFGLFSHWGRKTSRVQAAAAATTATAELRTIAFSITVAGEISPAEQVSVRPEINGRIDKLPVDVGDKVQKNQLLFTLDDHDLQLEIEGRETEVASARLELEQSRREYERNQELYSQKLLAKEAFEQSKTKLDLGQASSARAEKALALARERRSKTSILAPFDSTVLTRPVSVGQAVSGSGGFNSGTEVLTIADLSKMVVNVHLNQADLPKLRTGRLVEVQVEGMADVTVKGLIDRISPQAAIKNNVRGFPGRILLQEIPPGIQPGMIATVSIPVVSISHVVAVPLSAVFSDLNESTRTTDQFVYVKHGLGFDRRPVKIGAADLFYAEVQKGLSAGEIVSLVKPELAQQ